MPKIFVIGTGNVGGVGLHKMAQQPDIFEEIYVLSRTLQKSGIVKDSIAKKTKGKVRLNLISGDAGNGKALLALFKKIKPDLLVHWGHPYDNLVVMDACLKYGVNYIDTACYEDPKKYGFSHKRQWAKDKDFKEKGLLALLGAGFDPGVTNVFSAYGRDYLFDEVHEIDILDCNGGSKDKKIKFAPNFDPEINLRELILPVKFWKDGQWKEKGRLIDEEAVNFDFDFPEAGVFSPYLMYHEEMESIVRRMPHLKRIRFWMTFSETYLWYLRVLYNVGLIRIDPVKYDGALVVPVKFLKQLLPKGKDFNKSYKGKTCIGNIMTGIKDGKKKTLFIYNVCDHQAAFRETGGNAIGYTTAIPTVTAAKLVLEGKWSGAGVRNMEDRCFDSKIFLDEMPKTGLDWQIKELNEIPDALKKNY
ncbi:MAG: saccharopine dehydrogenase family protein [Candidatus Portnoybacteria bacterium]|nr:saccharopine dehydrogenase family protein [Candidatus Portnoybacteria bacterium]